MWAYNGWVTLISKLLVTEQLNFVYFIRSIWRRLIGLSLYIHFVTLSKLLAKCVQTSTHILNRIETNIGTITDEWGICSSQSKIGRGFAFFFAFVPVYTVSMIFMLYKVMKYIFGSINWSPLFVFRCSRRPSDGRFLCTMVAVGVFMWWKMTDSRSQTFKLLHGTRG